MNEPRDDDMVLHPAHEPDLVEGGGNPEGNNEEPCVIFECLVQGRVPPDEVALVDRVASWLWVKVITIMFNIVALCFRVFLHVRWTHYITIHEWLFS